MATETSKVLAVCLAFLERELDRRLSEMELPSQPEHSQVDLTPEIEKLTESLQQIADTAITDLPDGLIFESHLNDLADTLNTLIENRVDSLSSEFETRSEQLAHDFKTSSASLHECLQRSEQDGQSRTTELKEALESSVSEVSKNLVEAQEALKKYSDEIVYEKVASLANEVSDRYIMLREFVTTSSSGVVDILNSAKVELEALIEQTKKSANHSIEVAVKALDKKIDSNKLDTDRTVARLDKTVQNGLQRLERDKAPTKHSHDEYARKSHTHDDYATKRDLKGIESVSTRLTNDIKNTLDEIKLLKSEVKSKASKADLLKLEDINQIEQRIKKNLQDQIPEVRNGIDGKDAHEWEFRWHPTIKGRLMFKREDQKEWKFQDLLVKVQTPSSVGVAFGGGGGGGGGGGAVQINKYKKILSGFTTTITLGEHRIPDVSIVDVFNPAGYEVLTSVRIINNDVIIESNILLDNHYAILG